MPFATTGTAALYYEAAGEGDPVVFVHAGIADSRMWHRQVADLARDHRTVVYDMRGFGRSAPVPGPFSSTDDLLGLLDALDVGSAHLVGCSFGGMVAMDLALTAPDRVRSLTMIASRPAGYDTGDADDPRVAAIAAAEQAGDLDAVNELEVDLWVVGHDRSRADVDPAIVALILDANAIALANERRGLGDPKPFNHPEGLSALAALRVPLLVVHGEHDLPWACRAAADMAALIPGTRVVEIPGAAHLPGLEAPGLVNAELRAFLDARRA
ncbi:alpha/beta fold hydrolase [Actinokineospora sp. 24-640]